MRKSRKQKHTGISGFLISYAPQLILLLLSGLLVQSYEFIPTKKLNMLPLYPLSLSPYSDQVTGGNSIIEWSREEFPNRYSCVLKKGQGYPFCGLIVTFDYGKFKENGNSINLNRYDQFNVRLKTSPGLEFVRLHIRSKTEPYYDPTDKNSTMFMSTMLPKGALNRDFIINMDAFRVDKWWSDIYNKTDIELMPDFEKIMTLAFDITSDNAKDQLHTLEIEMFELEGKAISRANWYLLIMSMWALYFLNQIAISGYKFFQQSRKDKELLIHLEKVHKQLKEKNIEYKKDSLIDPLTQVFNRRAMDKSLEKLNTENDDTKIASSAVIFCDIDHFKKINDTYGHDHGDTILKEFANILTCEVRSNDTVTRWGGEEFVLLCPNVTPMQGYAIAEKMRIKIESTKFANAAEPKVTASFGVSCFVQLGNFEKALQQADDALYQAKESGRNRVVLCDKTHL